MSFLLPVIENRKKKAQNGSLDLDVWNCLCGPRKKCVYSRLNPMLSFEKWALGQSRVLWLIPCGIEHVRVLERTRPIHHVQLCMSFLAPLITHSPVVWWKHAFSTDTFSDVRCPLLWNFSHQRDCEDSDAQSNWMQLWLDSWIVVALMQSHLNTKGIWHICVTFYVYAEFNGRHCAAISML